MNTLLLVAAAGEAVTGLVLLVHPPIVVRLLFGADIAGAGVVMSRMCRMKACGSGLAGGISPRIG